MLILMSAFAPQHYLWATGMGRFAALEALAGARDNPAIPKCAAKAGLCARRKLGNASGHLAGRHLEAPGRSQVVRPDAHGAEWA